MLSRVDFDGRPYWKPRDFAALLDVSLSRVHQLVEDGELEHRRIGECAIRIPACAVAGLRGEKAPVVSPTAEGQAVDLAECVDRFLERTSGVLGSSSRRGARVGWGIPRRTPATQSRRSR